MSSEWYSRRQKKDRSRIEKAREGTMNSKARSCVPAIAAAGILMLSSYVATTAFGEDAAGVPDSALKGKKVAYVACSDLNRWCRKGRRLIVDALEAKGVIVTDLQDPYDPVLQAQHLDQAIAQRPDLIVLLATNARSVVPSLRRAKAAGIPVINFVGPTVPESQEYYLASIENNHHQLGEFAATNLVEGLKKEGRTAANIIVVTGAQVQPEVAVRMDGFKSVLDKYPEYKIVDIQDGNWDQGKTADIARTLFAKYADKGGVQGALAWPIIWPQASSRLHNRPEYRSAWTRTALWWLPAIASRSAWSTSAKACSTARLRRRLNRRRRSPSR
jgi:ABC-type sugar transport system substrate-binding protein